MAEYAEIIRDIRKGKFAPVYFLQGEEPFFIDNILEQIETTALEESQKGFNQYVLYGKETTFNDLLNIARKYPMMGERQVVIVKEAQEIKEWSTEKSQALLSAYVDNPLPSTILALGYKYKTLDRRTRLCKLLESKTVFLNAKRIYDSRITEWIQSYANSVEANLSRKAIAMLAENIGNNLQRLANEVDKLKLNLPDGQEIDDRAVQKYVGISKDYNTFELQKALSFRDEVKAHKIVNYFAANPSANPLVVIIASLFTYYSKLLIIHHRDLHDKQSVARAIGVNPYFAGEYMQAAHHYPQDIVVRNLAFIHEADLQSKGIGYSSMNPRQVLRELIFKLLH